MSALFDYLGRILSWILDVLLWLPRKAFELLADGVIALIQVIGPCCGIDASYINNAFSGAAAITPGVFWFLDLINFQAGFQMVACALVARFLLKFIPTLGF